MEVDWRWPMQKVKKDEKKKPQKKDVNQLI